MCILSKKATGFSLLVALILALSLPVSAQVTSIRVAYTDWFPYTYQENGNALGFEIETLQAVLKTMNIQAEFVNYPWKRCLESLENGNVDALVSLLKTTEREAYTFFPTEYISLSKTMFFTLADKQIQFTGSYEALKDYTIGIIRGFSYGEAFDNAAYLKKDDARDTQMLLDKLLNNRNDLAAENHAVFTAYAMKAGAKDKIRVLEPPIHTQKLYVGFSKAKDLKTLCDDFSKALSEFRQTDAYKTILQKYGIAYEDMVEAAK